MKTKILLAAITSLGIISGPLSKWCVFENGYCYTTWVSHILLSTIQPLHFFFLYASPSVFILLFVNDSMLKSWLRFAVYFLPLILLFVILTPAMPTPGTFLDPFPFYRVNAAELAGQVFSVATFILVIWRYANSYRLVRKNLTSNERVY